MGGGGYQRRTPGTTARIPLPAACARCYPAVTRPVRTLQALTLVALVAGPLCAEDHLHEARILRLRQNGSSGRETLAWIVRLPLAVLPKQSPLEVGGTLRVLGID